MGRIRVRGRKTATESQSAQRVLERNYIRTGLNGPDFIEKKATDFFSRN
ncbi:hypothetical protein [Marispirochaeta aestuarii]|nr:hypothetical protein [Marispirochaeta aestuarii]